MKLAKFGYWFSLHAALLCAFAGGMNTHAKNVGWAVLMGISVIVIIVYMEINRRLL